MGSCEKTESQNLVISLELMKSVKYRKKIQKFSFQAFRSDENLTLETSPLEFFYDVG